VRANVAIDWTVWEHARANLRVRAPAEARGAKGIRRTRKRRPRKMLLEQAELWAA
jgi:hypothetical protein